MKSRTFLKWITVLLFLLIVNSAYTQSAMDFEGQWVGYLKVNGTITYNISFVTKEVTSKKISGLLGYMSYPVVNKIIKEDDIVLTYDKQKQIAYCNTSIPAGPGKECTGYIILKISKKKTFFLDCELKLNKECMVAQMVLARSGVLYNDPEHIEYTTQSLNRANVPVSAATVTDSLKQISPGNAATSKAAPVLIKKVQADTITSFKINPKDVTHPADKDFKWFEWSKAPTDIIAATHFIHMNNFRDVRPDEILFDEIQKYLSYQGTTVRIAAIDLDNDGICGLAIEAAGSMYCGTMGCTYEFYENGGLTSINGLNDHGPFPDKNRVKTTSGSYYPLRSNKITVDAAEITRLFTYNNSAIAGIKKTPQNTNSKTAPVLAKRPTSAALTGGATVEQLGMQVVKALKTNDRKLWMSCIHPDVGYVSPYDSPGILDDYAKTFGRMREYFETHGVAQWDKLSYSITSFNYKGPDKVINIEIEFHYKGKEYICIAHYGSARKFKGRYYFDEVPNQFEFNRNTVGN